MRNLLQYPITADEVLEVVNTSLGREVERKLIGGIDGYVLNVISQYLIDHPDVVQDIVEQAKV